MKGRVVVIVLVLISIALGIGLLYRHSQATRETQVAQSDIMRLSNVVVETKGQVDDLKSVNASLETNLFLRITELETVSNHFVSVSAALSKAQADARAAAEAAAAEMAKRDARINELQGQNDEMTKRMLELNTSLGTLEKQISDTEKKLAASEGDREFLLRELKRLQSEKAQLEKQFNDLAVLREQVSRLKEELSISRRLEWIRRGILGTQTKGAEALIRPAAPVPAGTNVDLNVELKQGGEVNIQSGTNAPPPTNSPPQ